MQLQLIFALALASVVGATSLQVCNKDDPDFEFKKNNAKDCDWVAKKPNKRCNKMNNNNKRVRDSCPSACDVRCTCLNSKRFKFGNKMKKCKQMRSRHCKKNASDGKLVSDFCPKKCNSCFVPPSESPTEMPSASPSKAQIRIPSTSPTTSPSAAPVFIAAPSSAPSSQPSLNSAPSQEPSLQNDCFDGACKNGGTCIDRDNSFTCVCTFGWQGDDCSELVPNDIDDTIIYTGCYASEQSRDTHTVSANNRAIQCRANCPLARFFGVAETVCSCLVEVPTQLLAFGSCVSPSIVGDTPMELYFNVDADITCDQERSKTVRNFLVEEDDSPFGFDIVSNTFVDSPFLLYKEQCGTNIYEVQTQVSESDKSLKTSVTTVTSFSEELRTERSQSLAISAEAGYEGIAEVSVSVSAKADSTQASMFKSTGASEQNARVFTSLGIRRTAEVKIKDFENKKKFVTLSRTFGNLLRDYMNSGDGFSQVKGYEIIEKYGQFVLTRGLFGGYVQLRTVSSETSVESSFADDEKAKQCYEGSVAAEGAGYGFSASGSVDASTCSETEQKNFNDSKNQFESETSAQTIVGGSSSVLIGNTPTFDVFAYTAVLLTEKDKYPANDGGAEFRLLSDFLAPDKISPLTVKAFQITFEEFGLIQTNLQGHILQYLQDVEGTRCDCGAGIDYLEEDPRTGKRTCACYSPLKTVEKAYSPFTQGIDGWTTVDTLNSGIRVNSDFGNPGAHVFAQKTNFDGLILAWYFVAPSKFLGDVNGCTLSYDISSSAGSAQFPPGKYDDIIIYSNFGALYFSFFYLPTPFGTWVNYEVLLDTTTEFKRTDGSVASDSFVSIVLSNISGLRIRGMYVFGPHEGRMDNTKLVCREALQ